VTEARTLGDRLQEHLSTIYPQQDIPALARRLIQAIGLTDDSASPSPHRNLWSEQDAVLITYGDTLCEEGVKPLHTLADFLRGYIGESFSAVHILPFFPYSSDDGFSVIDYLSVNPALGEWEEITAIAEDYKLMADVVINHASSRGRWFENFKMRVDPGKDYFFEADPGDDLSQVVRPRSSPLLTSVATADGERHVWCTFSPDQVDLNFANPEVLLEFVNILRHYLEWGIKWFRMDAVAFLWKEVGSDCMHLPQTHELIKLLRTLIEHHTPEAVVITETNVPNRENLTYFGNANEAHVIYNFSLPPLLVHCLVSGNCRHLKTWMMSMPPAQAGTAYLNFIASHDGIGLRPLDGLLEENETERLLNCMEEFGGRLTTRRARKGHNKPYEINIALFDAFKGTIDGGADEWQQERFLCAHRIMLALEGIPAIYIHSLFGTGNDYHRLEHTGRNRSINRHIWDFPQLQEALDDSASHHAQVFNAMRSYLDLRLKQPAFHPNATQFTMHLGGEVFAFWRQSMDRDQSIFCLNNVTNQNQDIQLADINLIDTDNWRDLLSGKKINLSETSMSLAPYQSVWLSNV
jgi:sucrose phosphorylase